MKAKGIIYSKEQLLSTQQFTPQERDWLSGLLPTEGCTLEEASKILADYMKQEAK
jgi:hypothetical protein